MRPDAINWADKTDQVSLQMVPHRTMHRSVWRWIVAAVVAQACLALLFLAALQGPWRTEARAGGATALAEVAAELLSTPVGSDSYRDVQAALNGIAQSPTVKYAAVVDESGRLVRASMIPKPGWTDYKDSVTAAVRGPSSHHVVRQVDPIRGLVVVESPIAGDHTSGTQRLVMAVSDDVARRSLLTGGLAIVVSTVGVILLMLIVAHRQLREWTAGLGRLHSAIRRMSLWDDPKPLAVGGADEIAYLSVAFNDMASKVLGGRRALLEANRDLERRVAQRTEELSHANGQLTQSNDMLAQVTETALRFTDDVAHEFRTPLTVIGEFSAIIADGIGGQVTDKQLEYLNFISDASKDLANLVDDFLDSSKLRAGSLRVDRRPHAVQDILDSVWPMLETKAASNGLSLERHIAADVPTVFADIDKARRTVINLAVNAIKFCKSGGVVRIAASRSKADGADISVSDQGPGLSQDETNALFERFRQGSEGSHSASKGFGLGLSIVRELVDLNLGSVTVKSQVGVGSTFSFSLPPDDPAAILDCYLRRAVERSPSAVLSVVRTWREQPSATSDDLQAFLAAVLRPTDLQLCAADGQSVCVISATADPTEWCAQLVGHDEERRLHHAELREHPVMAVPLGSKLPGEIRSLILHALSSTTAESPCHA